MSHITMKSAKLSLCSGGLSKRTYFDELSESCLENVLRHLSSRPRRLDWKTWLDRYDVEMIFDIGGSLSNVCTSIITAISTEFPREMLRSDRKRNVDQEGNGMVYLNHLELTSDMSSSPLYNFLSRCTSLKNLTLADVTDASIFDNILAETGGRLKCLRASGSKNEHVLSIARYCLALNELVLIDGDKNFKPIWQATGASLKKVVIEKGLSNAREIDSFALHCHQIEHLNLGPIASGCEAKIANVYSSYRAQLKFAHLQGMELKHCRIIGKSCKNVLIIWTSSDWTDLDNRIFWRSPGCTDAIGYFGNRVDTLTIQMRVLEPKDTKEAQNLNQCSALTKLYVQGFTHRYVQMLFGTPRTWLKTLYLEVEEFITEDDWNVVAQSTGGLHALVISGVLPDLNAIGRILRANLMLRGFHVVPNSHHHRRETLLRFVIDIINMLPALPKLQHFFFYSDSVSSFGLEYHAMIQRACSVLRYRSVSVNIYGIEYPCEY